MYTPPTNPIDLSKLDKPELLSMYRHMALAREFEEKLYYLFLTRTMPGTMHQATGQEAVAVGVMSALRPDDYITSTHRGHEHCVAKDVPVNEMMAEMFAEAQRLLPGTGWFDAPERFPSWDVGSNRDYRRGHPHCGRRSAFRPGARN